MALLATLGFVPAAGAASGARAQQSLPTLYVNYTMNCTFTITDDSGAPVTSIAPGDYEVVVSTPIMFKLVVPGGQATNDLAPGDFTGCKGWVQFALNGPGVNLSTTLDFGCDSSQILPVTTFRPSSTYTVVDGNQPSVARATFTTRASGSPTTPGTSAYTATSGKGDVQTGIVGSNVGSGAMKAKSLDLTLAANGASILERNGKVVKKLASGTYRLKIADRDPKAGFTLLGPTSTKPLTLSGTSFVGKRSVTVKLTPGRWLYYADIAKQRSLAVAG